MSRPRKRTVRVSELTVGDQVVVGGDARYVSEFETRTVRSIEPSKSGETVRIEYSGGPYHPRAPRQPTLSRFVEVVA